MKRIPFTPYPGEVVVFTDYAAFSRRYKKIYGQPHARNMGEVLGTTVRIEHRRGGQSYLVYVKPRRRYHTTLLHELTHVALMLFDYIGIPQSSGSGEPFCYFLDHLFEQAKK